MNVDPTAILVAVLGGLNAIAVAALTVFGPRLFQRVERVRAQVENSHSTNLRDELDARHTETRSWFAALWHRHDTTDRNVERNTRAIENIVSALDLPADTIPPKEK